MSVTNWHLIGGWVGAGNWRMIQEKLPNWESLRVTQVRTKRRVFMQVMIEYLCRWNRWMGGWVGGGGGGAELRPTTISAIMR